MSGGSVASSGNELLDLRATVYRHFAETGHAPTASSLQQVVGDAGRTTSLLRELHQNHMVVLDASGEIAMALPFSARPTGHTVAAEHQSWWANCAWDALAIVAALDTDAQISATWLDTGEDVEIAIADGTLDTDEGFVHFAIPARHWWDDIVET